MVKMSWKVKDNLKLHLSYVNIGVYVSKNRDLMSRTSKKVLQR